MNDVSSTVVLAEVTSRLRAAGCVFAEDEAELLVAGGSSAQELEALVVRRVAGLPLEHLLGWAEFCGLRIRVDPGVFVPRRRTEFVVAEAIALLQAVVPVHHPVVADMCCGSGAIGVAVAHAVNIDLHAVDIDPTAVVSARRNVLPVGGHVYQGDLYGPLPKELRGRIDVLLANAPYVPTAAIATMPPEARIYEPAVALDGGNDGLAVQRRVISEARHWLAPGGHLLIETSEQQCPHTVQLVLDSGLRPRVAGSEDFDSTVVIGTKISRTADGGRDPV